MFSIQFSKWRPASLKKIRSKSIKLTYLASLVKMRFFLLVFNGKQIDWINNRIVSRQSQYPIRRQRIHNKNAFIGTTNNFPAVFVDLSWTDQSGSIDGMFFVRSGFPIVPDFGIEFDLKKLKYNFLFFFSKIRTYLFNIIIGIKFIDWFAGTFEHHQTFVV